MHLLRGRCRAASTCCRAPARTSSWRPASCSSRLAPADDLLARELGTNLGVDDRVHRAGVVNLIGRDRRGVGRTRPRMREHLRFERGARHAGRQDLRHARVLVAETALEVFPLRIGRILRRIQRIERDVARAARGPDQKRRLDRTVGQAVQRRVARLRILRQCTSITFPARQAAVDLEPARLVEARVRKLAIAQCSGRSTECKIARRLALVLRLVVRISRIDRRFLEVARRIAIAGASDELQQLIVAGAPLESVGLLEAGGRTILRSRNAAARVVDDSPRSEAIVALVRVEHAIPVDQHVDALLEDVGVKPGVSRGGLVPNLASGTLRRIQNRLASVKARMVRRGFASDRCSRSRRRSRRSLRDNRCCRRVLRNGGDSDRRAHCNKRDRIGRPFHS